MGGVIAIVTALLAFGIPIAVPLFAQRWRTLVILLGLGALFFAWVNLDLASPDGITQTLGPFTFGLMLFGFAAGAIAKFVMLLSRR
jgi:hypothetical protein